MPISIELYLIILLVSLIGYFLFALIYLYYDSYKKNKIKKQYYEELDLSIGHVDLYKKTR